MNFKNTSEYFSPLVMNVLKVAYGYSGIHGWLSSSVCVLGIVLNAFNVIFLHKSRSINSCAVNTILISIALCDSIIMALYLPFSVHFYILNSNSMFTPTTPDRDSRFWSYYSLLIITACVTLHSISAWLTVYLSMYRYLYMKEAVNSIRLSAKKTHPKSKNPFVQFILYNSKKNILIMCLFCFLFCLPSYFYPIVSKYAFTRDSNNSDANRSSLEYVYLIEESKLNIKSNNFISKLSFYLLSIFGKIFPSLCLAVFIALILKNLRIIRKNRENLTSKNVSKNVSFFVHVNFSF